MATKQCTKCGNVQPLSAFSKCKLGKHGLQAWCRPCMSAAAMRWAAKNKQRVSDWAKEWRRQNPAKARAQYARSDASRDFVKRDDWLKSKRLALNATAKAWRDRNPDLCLFFDNRRRATKAQAMPSWVDRSALLIHYEKARLYKMHVDHIVPLHSKLVCGLHVPWNLQLLSPLENVRKGNRHWPDGPME